MLVMELDRSAVATIVGVALTALYYLTSVWWPWYKRQLENIKPFDQLPMPPGSHWLTGHRHLQKKKDFRISYQKLMKDHANEQGLTGFWIWRMRVLAVNNYKDGGTILRQELGRRRFWMFHKHLNNFLGSRNIGVLQGREWRVHRAAITRAIGRPVTLQSARLVVCDVTDTIVKAIKDAIESAEGCFAVDDVEPLMKMITMDVFGKFALSYDLECCKNLKASPIAQAFDLLSSELTRRLKAPLKPSNFFYGFPNEFNRQHREQRTFLCSFLRERIEERRSTGKKQDLLSEILLAFEEENEKDLLDNQTLQEILLSLLFAGYDITSIALTYLLYLVSQNAKVEDNIVEEVQRFGVDNPDQLKYTEAALMEGLRLYPPASATIRYLQKPVKLSDGFVAPAETMVYVPIWLIQRDDRNFSEPDSFRPDRWVKKEGDRCVVRAENDNSGSIAAGNRSAFLAFSAGARDCPGQKFALQEAVMVVAGLFKDLRFHSIPGYEMVPLRKGLLHGPKGGLPMKIVAR